MATDFSERTVGCTCLLTYDSLTFSATDDIDVINDTFPVSKKSPHKMY